MLSRVLSRVLFQASSTVSRRLSRSSHLISIDNSAPVDPDPRAGSYLFIVCRQRGGRVLSAAVGRCSGRKYVIGSILGSRLRSRWRCPLMRAFGARC